MRNQYGTGSLEQSAHNCSSNRALAAGIGQADHGPPDWKQGVVGYGERFASNFSIAAIGTTTRYALAEAFNEDTLYYRCDCKGALARARHAVTSSFIARHGDDGHREFSFPALIAPYAGAMAAVYGWYPRRYDARDAFRMGNYSLLGYLGGNIGLEFLYSGPHSLVSRMHLNMSHGGMDAGSPPVRCCYEMTSSVLLRAERKPRRFAIAASVSLIVKIRNKEPYCTDNHCGHSLLS